MTNWHPKASLNARAIRLFIESVNDIGDALRFPSNATLVHMESAARRVSIELRKLLFDGGPLFHAVLHRPRLHPLFDKSTLMGEVYENERQISIAPGTSQAPDLESVSTHRWKIAVHPLHGLGFDRTRNIWSLHSMFDSSAASVRLDQWLRQRLFCVESREYSLAATLKYLANKEAAHVDTENTILSQDMESVHFGNTCYYHFVAILTSAYLLAQFKHSVQANKTEWQYLLDRRGYTITDRGTFLDAELSGLEIEPIGLPHAFHETGISIPHPGWTPVHIEESTVVWP